MEIKYSKLESDEVSSFYLFFKETIAKFFTSDYSENTINHFLTKDYGLEYFYKATAKGNVLVAKDGENYVGFLVFENPYGGVIFCNWISVAENYQKKGIASNMLRMFEEEAIKLGCHCLLLQTEKRNLEFYKRRGFVYYGMVPKGYFGTTDYYFYKQIQEPKEENFLK